eukprot:TRINITY_DN37914_c0_g1_i2.p1 TRINITY_DN37914_c0_g1~~TRINITY_DN37914_c0_g1_i2.p1  ORF type:complete len:428 (+),score=104.16 TRINITY_DN37914_c0_g1_i2:23-1306(+)
MVPDTAALSIKKGYLSMFMNRPWKPKFDGYIWGGDEDTLLPDEEWMQHKVFPDDEMRVEHPIRMTIAFWRFMLRWKQPSARWCLLMVSLQGLVPPLAAQALTLLLDEIESGLRERGKAGALMKHLPGTPSNLVEFYCCFLLSIYCMDIVLAWSYDMNIPGLGVQRELKVRLLRKFLAMDGETAKLWPPGKCSAMLLYDVPNLVDVWTGLFNLTKQIMSIFGSVAIVLLNNNDVYSTVEWLPFFLLLHSFTFLDFYLRREHLVDLSSRKRDWLLAEANVSAMQIQEQRDLHKGDTPFGQDCFWATSFVSFYRSAHAGMMAEATEKSSGQITHVGLVIVAWVCAMSTLHGEMTVGESAATVLVYGILTNIQRNLVTSLTKLELHYPSLRGIAEVLNSSGHASYYSTEESSEDSDEGQAVLTKEVFKFFD